MRENPLEAHKALLLQKWGNTRTWAGAEGQYALCPVTQGAESQTTDCSSADAGHCGERWQGRGYSNRDGWRTRVARAARATTRTAKPATGAGRGLRRREGPSPEGRRAPPQTPEVSA